MTDNKRVEEIVTSTRLTTEKKVLAILKLIEEAEKRGEAAGIKHVFNSMPDKMAELQEKAWKYDQLCK